MAQIHSLHLWKEILEQFVPLFSGSITIIDCSGVSLACVGVPPEGCTPRSVLDTACLYPALAALSPWAEYSCSHGTEHTAVPIKKEHERIGILVCSGSSSSLQKSALRAVAAILPRVFEKDSVELQLLRERCSFLPFLLTTNTIENLCKKALSYFVLTHKLANATVILEQQKYRYNNMTTLDPMLSVVEERVLKSLQETKTPFVIRNAAEDSITKDIPHIEKISYSLVSYPLVHDRTFFGGLLLWFSQDLDFVSCAELVDQLALAMRIIQRYVFAAQKAQTDPLTQLPNRIALSEMLSRFLLEGKEQNKPSSLAVIDIDNFKQFNDQHGHLAGDDVLARFALLLQEVITPFSAFRYGGEEFVMFFPKTGQESRVFAEKILVECREKLGITVSIGMTTCQNSSLNAQELLSEADKALYRAKNSGKNKIVHSLLVDKYLGVIDIETAESVGKQ